MRDHTSNYPCRPCQIGRQFDLASDSLLTSFGEIDSLPDALGEIEELEETVIED
jgi:hypothetical protein